MLRLIWQPGYGIRSEVPGIRISKQGGGFWTAIGLGGGTC